MTALLWLGRATGLVPGWCWAIAVGVLAVLVLGLDAGRAEARADAALARTQLLQVQLASRDAIAIETARAQARVRDLTKIVLETQDELSQSRQAVPGRVAALDERLRHIARPMPCAGPAPVGGASAPAGSGDGQPGAGLPGLAGGNFVVLDGQAQRELAGFAVSCQQTGETLKACRSLLRAGWRSP